MDRRKFLKNMAGITGLAAINLPLHAACTAVKKHDHNLYWGDIHCHCGISYGRGSLEDAFDAAREQRLDFCAVVGHSSWHDTPRDEEHMNRIKDYIVYHDEGYERLARLWPDVKRLTRDVTEPGKFIPFLSFEWHSIKYGDHNVYYLDPEGEIVKADSIEELREKMSSHKAIVIPHHIGYLQGSRGINWDHFVESDQSPFVEVYSFHGCSVNDTSPYPMIREMGPRSYERTLEVGLKRGFKMGIIGSTDNHYGYPGSYGEGKVAVFADELTKDSLWEAFRARRVYAVTGDRIVVDFNINGALMGQAIGGSGKREIAFSVRGEDFLDYVDVVKNDKVIGRFQPPFDIPRPGSSLVRAKIRLQWGWGQKDRLTGWEGTLRLADGRLLGATPCFRAQPSEGDDKGREMGALDRGGTLISRITDQDESGLAFSSYSYGNPSPLTPINNSMVLDVEMPRDAAIRAKVNGREFEHTLAELLEGQRSHLVGGYLDVAVSFFHAAPEAAFTLEGGMVDDGPENKTDYYYLCARQRNDQWAWSSPIWVSA
jgi:hypothetical protein